MKRVTRDDLEAMTPEDTVMKSEQSKSDGYHTPTKRTVEDDQEPNKSSPVENKHDDLSTINLIEALGTD